MFVTNFFEVLLFWYALHTRVQQSSARRTSPSPVLSFLHQFIVQISILLSQPQLRDVGCVSWVRPIGWIVSALGAFPVSRGTADREALRRCIAVLEAGEPLVLFPEGTRQSGPLVQPLFDGATYVAAKAGVPIIPVGIGGSERVMPKGSKMIYPRKCVVVIGTPIQTIVNGAERLPRSALKELSGNLSTELQRLFDEAQRLAGCPNKY